MTIKVTHSSDGVEIPDDGVTYTFLVGPQDEQVEQSITLHDCLAGLNMEIRPGRKQAQAKTFASFALQMGFTNEEDILSEHREARPYLNEDGDVASNAWRLISRWEQTIQAQRQKKARQTMRESGREITPGQMNFAWNLIPRLRANSLETLANDIMEILQINEEVKGPQGAVLSASLDKAKTLLDLAEPKHYNKPQPTASVQAQPSEEEPF